MLEKRFSLRPVASWMWTYIWCIYICTYNVHMYMFTYTHTFTYCVIFPHSSERVTTLEVHICTIILYMFVYSTYYTMSLSFGQTKFTKLHTEPRYLLSVMPLTAILSCSSWGHSSFMTYWDNQPHCSPPLTEAISTCLVFLPVLRQSITSFTLQCEKLL